LKHNGFSYTVLKSYAWSTATLPAPTGAGGPPDPSVYAGRSKEDVMTRELDSPVFDGDNHLHETRDALTAYLTKLMKVGA
jgi:hypothetical protein